VNLSRDAPGAIRRADDSQSCPAISCATAPRPIWETHVVTATVAYLTARQSPDDLPGQLDLDDVLAAYAGYVDDMSALLGSRNT
jgi:hypothetical protein